MSLFMKICIWWSHRKLVRPALEKDCKNWNFPKWEQRVCFKNQSLTCCVLFYFFEHVVIHTLLLLIPLLWAIFNRDHCEVGGHFYTMCFFSVSSVCHTVFLSSFPPVIPLFYSYHLSPSLLSSLPSSVGSDLLLQCLVLVITFFIPIEDSAVHPCDSAIQTRKSMTAPPKGGGI